MVLNLCPNNLHSDEGVDEDALGLDSRNNVIEVALGFHYVRHVQFVVGGLLQDFGVLNRDPDERCSRPQVEQLQVEEVVGEFELRVPPARQRVPPDRIYIEPAPGESYREVKGY